MTRPSYQIKAEKIRNQKFRTISVRLRPGEYKLFSFAAARQNKTPAGMARELIRRAIPDTPEQP